MPLPDLNFWIKKDNKYIGSNCGFETNKPAGSRYGPDICPRCLEEVQKCNMQVPVNYYKKGTIMWSIVTDDWSDLKVSEIAEVLDANKQTVYSAISNIKKETGYCVPHVSKTIERLKRIRFGSGM